MNGALVSELLSGVDGPYADLADRFLERGECARCGNVLASRLDDLCTPCSVQALRELDVSGLTIP